MSLVNIASYIKDTERNIITRSAAVDGQFAFAVDTGNMFLSMDGSWKMYTNDDAIGEYTIPGQAFTLPHVPMCHFDANDATTLQDGNYQPINSGDHVGRWTSVTDGGIYNVEQPAGALQPKWVVDGLGSGKNSVRFRSNAHMHTLDKDMLQKTYNGDWTVFWTMRNDYQGTSFGGGVDKTDQWRDYHSIWGASAGGSSGSTTLADYLGYMVRWSTARGSHYWYAGGEVSQVIAGTDTTDFYDVHGIDPAGTAGQFNGDNLLWSGRIISSVEMQEPKMTEWRLGGNAFVKKVHWTTGMSLAHVRGMVFGGSSGTNVGGAHAVYIGRFDLGEFILFRGAMNDTNMNLTGNYLSTKWGATWLDLP